MAPWQICLLWFAQGVSSPNTPVLGLIPGGWCCCRRLWNMEGWLLMEGMCSRSWWWLLRVSSFCPLPIRFSLFPAEYRWRQSPSQVFLLLWYFPLVPGVRLPFGGHEPIWVLTPLNYTSEVFSPNDLKLTCPLSLGKIFPETNYWRRYYIPVLTDNHFNEVWRGILILKFNEAKMYPSSKYFLFFCWHIYIVKSS